MTILTFEVPRKYISQWLVDKVKTSERRELFCWGVVFV